MGVAVARKNTTDDPRAMLRRAIAEASAKRDAVERHQQAIQRARALISASEQRVVVAGKVLEAARQQHADVLAEAASTGTTPKAGGELRAARIALGDAQ